MKESDIVKLATVIANGETMTKRLDNMESKVDEVAITTVKISTQLTDFLERDSEKKKEHDCRLDSQSKIQTETNLEVARLKTKFKWAAGLSGTGAIGAIISKLL